MENYKPVVSLQDKYLVTEGKLIMSATQALVRVPMVQKTLDEWSELKTAGFISGYRGSPLGNLDRELWQAQSLLQEYDIHFKPGINEELAATACWGTQQLHFLPKALKEGVFSIWYGKGPGVDRAADALKHANLAGVSPCGGVLVLAGDDHAAKSSTSAHQSEQALNAAMIPILSPANVQEYLDFGLAGLALSRFSGAWCALKCLTETVETTGTVHMNMSRYQWQYPDIEQCPEGVHILAGFAPSKNEQVHVRNRMPAAQAFVRTNRLDRIWINSPKKVIGVVAAGKSFNDVCEALALLGIDQAKAELLGLSVYKPALVWPLEPEGIKDFASGQRELLVVEEKRDFIEQQVQAILYNLEPCRRPSVFGKKNQHDEMLFWCDGELSPSVVALTLFARLKEHGLVDDDIDQAIARLKNHCTAIGLLGVNVAERSPAFCSGCPHNISTKLPENSLALAGIGCHTIASFMPDRPTLPPVQMGGEGANWIGMSSFTGTEHIFQNLGDGTYFHSGILSVRAAVASGSNITFKILYNDAVAMTGGQPVDGNLDVAALSQQLFAEGVRDIAIVSDAPDAFHGDETLARGVEICHRNSILKVQADYRNRAGTSVIIYVQVCAAEKRRRLKRKTLPDPPQRYYINDLVCEGCGDCSIQSTCISIQPFATELGRKRRIDQHSCNKDYSCNKGFCPSFVTVTGGRLRKPEDSSLNELVGEFPNLLVLPEPKKADAEQRPYKIVITGVGGTGVVTVGALLGMAGHIEGLEILRLDITGLSQKNGKVMGHLQFAEQKSQLHSARIAAGSADLLIGCDLVASGAPEALDAFSPTRTAAVLNTNITPTLDFQFDRDFDIDGESLLARINERVNRVILADAIDIARRFIGDTVGANIFLLGVACQAGLLPISPDSIIEAIGLNRTAVALNAQAFHLGRLYVESPERFNYLEAVDEDETRMPEELTLDRVIEQWTGFLCAYQNLSYAKIYKDFVEEVRRSEIAKMPGAEQLTRSVAENLGKLMAYKDEYEVARLLTHKKFRDNLNNEFEGAYKITYNMSPSLIAPRDQATGLPRKLAIGSWLTPFLHLLKRLKFLRGTLLDPFGWMQERREERQLIFDYMADIRFCLERLETSNYNNALALAALPEQIRGFGHVKSRAIADAAAARQRYLEQFDQIIFRTSETENEALQRL